MERKRYKICLVSDFFFPNMGGVESHLFQESDDASIECLTRVLQSTGLSKKVGARFRE